MPPYPHEAGQTATAITSAVDNALNELSNDQYETEKLVAELHARLAPVLTPSIQTDEKKRGEVESAHPIVRTVEKIETRYDHQKRINASLRDILQRLDV